uniref:Chitin-binding type-2 domain-containing protein n=1 Tax=Clytia hemisphaerica TaxID=252671 RepID=A0A7M5UQ97_9CNID
MALVFVIHFLLIAALSGLSGFEISEATGTTPPAVPCPDKLCQRRPDGNYAYNLNGQKRSNYFLQCSGGSSYCQACFPLSLEYSPKCNQCLNSKNDACFTTKPWKPVKSYICPDMCPNRGHNFSGNIPDPYIPYQYIACWKGVTIGCVKCPSNLQFNEEANACLYDGLYYTKPLESEEYI